MTDTYDTDTLIGRTAIDPSGSKIGTISDIYADDETDQPVWLAISTGLFGTKVSFAPLAGAESSGGEVVIAYDKALVKDAPRAEADGHLSPEEEQQLYAHYGQPWTTRTADETQQGWTDRTERDPDADRKARRSDDRDAMTRSEEELAVNTRSREAGRVRLRKWIETEDVELRVPVRKEKAKLVTEPITDDNVDAAMSGDDLTAAEHEVVLSEEVVDVDKRVVPKERVRLETETETEEVAVDEQVRKERIDMDNDVDRPR
jgi:uncharacterized protein (TIGR02271 family)